MLQYIWIYQMKLYSTSLTDIGRLRKNNQDSYLCDDRLKLYLIADGLGGHAGGEVASLMAKETLTQFFSSTRQSIDVSSYFIEAMRSANRRIYDKSISTPSLKGMGTTLTALYFSYDTAYIAHVGDSRAYLIQEDMIWQLSQDHTLVSQKFTVGSDIPLKNILTRSVGYDAGVEVDLYTKKLSKDDIYLLCSDGLHGVVRDQEMAYIVCNQPLDSASNLLIRLANERGGEDNITVVLVKVERL